MDLIESNDYDLVLLDLELPKLHGLGVLKRVRAQNIMTPILVLTTHGSVSDRVAGLDNGADDYLTKPFEFAELLARVRALTRRGEQLVPPVIKVADLELDTAALTCARAGHPINLTRREYQLLDYLLRHAGSVCTCCMIGEHLWGFEFDLMSNVIDVHVARLRRKVDAESAIPLIHTVRDVGYSLHQ